MDNKTIAHSYNEIAKAFSNRKRKKKHLVVRLSKREQLRLTECMSGRSASASLEEIISSYLKMMKHPPAIEKSVKKQSFVISAGLYEELQNLADASGNTISAIVHAALQEAFAPDSDKVSLSE